MATTAISNPVSSSERARESRRGIRKRMLKSQAVRQQQQENQNPSGTWKSEKTEQIYSSKLVESLHKLTLNSTSPSTTGRSVREAADRALAVAAKGRTRWSRAILMKNRLKLKFMKRKRRRPSVPPAASTSGTRKPILRLKKGTVKNLPAVQRKVRVLGRLVPGCRKESLPVILEETTDYIEALEMQIRTMTALLTRVSGADANNSTTAGETD